MDSLAAVVKSKIGAGDRFSRRVARGLGQPQTAAGRLDNVLGGSIMD